jgi:glycosyltransferase involved in cell wall biosynthesis
MRDLPSRILYIDTCIDVAGGQASLIEILKRLDRTRFEPLVASPKASALSGECRRLGIQWFPLPFQSIHISSAGRPVPVSRILDTLGSLRGLLYLVWKIRQKHVHVVHANTFKAALIGGLASFFTSRPMIFHDRTLIRHGLLGVMVALMAKRIVAVSDAVACRHRERVRPRISVIRDGIDTERLAPSGRPLSSTVVYLGRISEEKGLDSLVEAAGLVLERVPDARFVAAGSPFTPDDLVFAEQVRHRIEELGLSEIFEMAGYVDDVRALLDEASVLVLPSRREALGIALLEAMSLERPVVAFDVGGPREVISNGDNGFLVKPADIEGLAEAIVRILKDDDLAGRLGKAARQTVLARFSGSGFAKKIMAVYDEMQAGT